MTEAVQKNVAETVGVAANSAAASVNSFPLIVPSIVFLAYLLLLGGLAVFMTKNDKHHEWALKIILVLAVIGSVVFVCLLNIPREYVTSIVGLLGTVAGFVLRGSSGNSGSQPKQEPPQNNDPQLSKIGG
jgi:hypothetical protein